MHREISEAIKSVGLDKKWAEEYREYRDERRNEGRSACQWAIARELFAEGNSLENIALITKLPLERLQEELRCQ